MKENDQIVWDEFANLLAGLIEKYMSVLIVQDDGILQGEKNLTSHNGGANGLHPCKKGYLCYNDRVKFNLPRRNIMTL